MTTLEPPRVAYANDDAAPSNLGEAYLRKLSSLGVTTYLDPRAVFDIVCGSDIDCMVNGYDMSAVTGVESLETIREDHDSFSLILFTGERSKEVADDVISAGVTDYLWKQPSPEQYELLVNRIENSVSEHRTTCRAERYETILETLGYPVYVIDERDRFEYVNDTFANHGGSEVVATVDRTRDGFYIEGDGDGLPDDRSPEEYFEVDGNGHRDGGLTRCHRLNF